MKKIKKYYPKTRFFSTLSLKILGENGKGKKIKINKLLFIFI